MKRRIGRGVRFCTAFLAFSICAVALAQKAPLLNSERIERQFGSYGIEVLHSDASLRLSDLFSEDRQTVERTTRTIALVEYPTVVAPSFAAAHRVILAGGSIGATLQADGWRVDKRHRYFGATEASAAIAASMNVRVPVLLAAHAYDLTITRGDERHHYATILEIHHPGYLTPSAVVEIYAPGWTVDRNQDIEPMIAALRGLGF